ncbi:MAG: hypothetical protein IPM96_19815 [Ignavibacteria bacterium]|nr:hypothetical protein [Ignavibacteria bacterium]
MKYFNYGSFEKFDEQSNSLGTFSANDLAVSVSYSNNFRPNFYYGANLKYIYSQIDDFNSSAVAVDLGLLYVILQVTGISVSVCLISAPRSANIMIQRRSSA